jgi:hypothetical protein
MKNLLSKFDAFDETQKCDFNQLTNKVNLISSKIKHHHKRDDSFTYTKSKAGNEESSSNMNYTMTTNPFNLSQLNPLPSKIHAEQSEKSIHVEQTRNFDQGIHNQRRESLPAAMLTHEFGKVHGNKDLLEVS